MKPFEWASPKTVYQAKQKLLFLELEAKINVPVSPSCANDWL